MKQRDGRMDCLKGIAITLVLVGHILQFGFSNGLDSPLFNVIWTLQIPLFILVSGYFGGPGKLRNIPKRALSYLVPFVSFFLIRKLVVEGNHDLGKQIGVLMYRIEGSLWYLFALFFLSTAHILAERFGTGKRTGIAGHIGYTLCYGLSLLPFGVLAVLVDMRFLGSHLILYYAPFFYLGRMWRALSIRDISGKSVHGGGTVRGILDAAALLALAVYLAIVSRFHTPELGDTLVQMLLRFTSSICGCYVVIRAVFASWREDSLPAKTMKVMGAHSLELYYFHSLFIPYIPKMETPLLSPKGLGYLTIYFGATLGLCELLRLVVCASPYVALVIMGKPIKNRKD